MNVLSLPLKAFALLLCQKKFERGLEVAARLDDFDDIDFFIELVSPYL